MSAAATRKQQHTVAKSPATSSSYSNNNNNSNNTTIASTSYSSSAAATLSALPKTFITAQNCLSNLRPLQVPTVATTTTLMLKGIETPTNEEDCYENAKEEEETKDKENERDICNVPSRRESVPEDVTILSNKLNTIEEGSELNKTGPSHPLSSSLNSKAQRHNDALTASANAAAVAPDTTTASEPSEETQNISNSSIERSNSITASAAADTNSQQFADSSSSQIRETTDGTTTTTVTVTAAAVASAPAPAGTTTTNTKQNKTPSPTASPRRKSSSSSTKGKLSKTPSSTKISNSGASFTGRNDEDNISKSSDTSGELVRATPLSSTQQDSAGQVEKSKSSSRLSERAKKKSWYNVLYPNYKSRSQDFKKLFKEVPNDERLIVDYSCALQRDILVQGRLYVSQNYVCFHANILGWETYLNIKWKDVTSITKEKTALVIPNAISICTAREKYFFATFTTRDKAFLMLFRVWQNTLMNKQMLPQEMWQWVHNCYGDELGLTTDDEDYIDPASAPAESETDLDFVSALEDSSVQSICAASLDGTDYNTAISNFNQSINQSAGDSKTSSSNKTPNSGGNSSASSGGGGGVGAGDAGLPISKSKSRSYFFNSNKSNLNSSNTASASGSDNKASDNSSNVKRNSSSNNKSQQMKANAKELTLESAMPPTEGANAGASATQSKDGNGAGGGGNFGAKEAKTTTVSAAASYEGKRKAPSKHTRQREESSIGKNSEASPTDISDSSDSDENKIPFVATAECTSTHEGRQLMHTILPINIDTLFNLLFSKSKFLVDFHDMRKSTDRTFGEWITNEEGQKTRTVNVTVQLAASVGPKNSKVTEYQVMRDCSKPSELYSIDITSVNAGIPYADSFSVLMHYCMVRTVDDHTMLSVHAQIKYKKSIWGVVKGFIEKNTWAGLEDFFTSLLHALQSETCIPPAKGKGRRPRRGTAAQIRPLEEPPAAHAKAEPAASVHPRAHAQAPFLPAKKPPLPGERQTRNKWLSVFVIVLLCFLIVLNVILLMKLWKLEERIEEDMSERARMPNLSSLKQLPNTHEDWMQLLRQQEILHETELKKWHSVLQTAIELLKKTEKTLAALMFR